MSTFSATAIAHPNIALIKYWGNKDHQLRIPVNGSLSFNLESLYTKTRVSFNPDYKKDNLSINSQEVE
ncbi:MAG TPA: diphosphomevalonate decarboxylase, partial [Anaerolineaceae bacterium]|nr:diphosphomevalonate decarboxylase [Anaerolineaceae bacterium]